MSILAGFLGYKGIVVSFIDLSQISFFLFLILFIFSIALFFLQKMDQFIIRIFKGGASLLAWTITFFVVAIIAGILGFTGIMATATEITKILFYTFLVLFVISVIVHFFKWLYRDWPLSAFGRKCKILPQGVTFSAYIIFKNFLHLAANLIRLVTNKPGQVIRNGLSIIF